MEYLKTLRNRINGFREIWSFDNRWELILQRIAFPGTGMLTYRLDGLELVVDHRGGDATGTRACLVSQMYRALLPHLDLRGRELSVLDLGANGGGFPLLLLSQGLRIGRLTAVEMNPRTFARLQLNVAQNIDAEAVLINGAVTHTAQMLTLRLGRGSTGESLHGAAQSDAEGRLTQIQGLTLDQVVKRGFGDGTDPIDLCKLDIEGAEYDVLGSSHASALRRVRYLIAEIHRVPGRSPETAIAALGDLGFTPILTEHQQEPDVYCFENGSVRASTC